MEKQQTVELLEFMLNSFRAQLAVQVAADTTPEGCSFDFQNFLVKWKFAQKSGKQVKGQLLLTLNLVIAQGLLDSILPYLVSALSHTMGREVHGYGYIQNNSLTKSNPTNQPHSAAVMKFRSDEKSCGEKEISSKSLVLDDCEIIIHVCDESRGLREDFQFQQSILTKEMGYFTHVAVKGQRLRDLDISVHCDLNIFDWLRKWMQEREHQENSNSSTIFRLDAKNVIGIVVSADFLLMPTLVSECLDFIHQNIEQIVTHSPNLSCLSESLVKKLAGYFRNLDLERRIVKFDRTDRISSRLFIQHILALNSPEHDLDFMSTNSLASTQSLFRCEVCGQLLINSIAPKVLCLATRFDSRGRRFGSHVRDTNWNLTNFIRELKRELKVWRRVYWRLWGTVNFFKCGNCDFYFPGVGLSTCRFHPDLTQSNPTLLSIPTIEEKLNYVRMTRNLGRNNAVAADDVRTLLSSKDSASVSSSATATVAGSLKSQMSAGADIIPGQPYTKYRCCREVMYRYTPHPRISGCLVRDHLAYDELDENWGILLQFRDFIVDENLEALAPLTLGGKIQLRPAGEQNHPGKNFLNHSNNKPSKYSIFMRTPTVQIPIGESSSTESDVESPVEELHDIGIGTGVGAPSCGGSGIKNSNKIYSQLDRTRDNNSWVWNPDLSTRYNQDMQREREETYMVKLASVLIQRVPLESSKFQFLRRRAPREDVGGSFTKLEHDFLT